MVNIMAWVVGLTLFLAVTFVFNTMLLQKEFNVESTLVNLFGVILTLWVVGFLGKKIFKKEVKPSI